MRDRSAEREKPALLTEAARVAYTEPIKSYRMVSLFTSPKIDPEYVKSLLSNSPNAALSPEQRAKNVADNAMLTDGNALKLDMSGYFLTAAHIYFDKDEHGRLVSVKSNIPPIIDFRRGEAYKPRQILANLQSDIAIVFAPTGRGRKPTGISFDNSPLVTQERYWLVGVTPHAPDVQFLSLSGKAQKLTVGDLGDLASVLGDNVTHSYVLEGLPAFPGLSGSPILNKDGVVVAVEKGQIRQAYVEALTNIALVNSVAGADNFTLTTL